MRVGNRRRPARVDEVGELVDGAILVQRVVGRRRNHQPDDAVVVCGDEEWKIVGIEIRQRGGSDDQGLCLA